MRRKSSPPRPILALALIVFALALSGCTALNRQARAETIAAGAGLAPLPLKTSRFSLSAWSKGETCPCLTIYIEGDGFAWSDKTTPSRDPTPKNPLALRLAALDPSPCLLYLARPCQFDAARNDPGCTPYAWTFGRFSPENVDAMDEAISLAKSRFKAQTLRLIGYSGGGTMALLLAAKRSDVTLVATAAGNLDHAAWTRLHGVSPMTSSLNPADQTQQTRHIPQIHFAGAKDTIVPPSIAESYLAKIPQPNAITITTVPNCTHDTNWEQQWPALLHTLPACP